MSTAFLERISAAQQELKAPKSQYNSFGKYNYRSCEDILEAVKPICNKYRLTLIISDSIKQFDERYYIEATATLFDWDSEKSISSTALARESVTKKGMDDSQVTGTASSYARKYALNGLFNIDDTKDADTDAYVKKTSTKQFACADCGKPFESFTDKTGRFYSAEQVFQMSVKKNKDGKARCAECRKKAEGEQ